MLVHKNVVFIKPKNFCFTIKNVFFLLSKTTILYIFYRFGDDTTKKIRHTRRHKLQPNGVVMKEMITQNVILNKEVGMTKESPYRNGRGRLKGFIQGTTTGKRSRPFSTSPRRRTTYSRAEQNPLTKVLKP